MACVPERAERRKVTAKTFFSVPLVYASSWILILNIDLSHLFASLPSTGGGLSDLFLPCRRPRASVSSASDAITTLVSVDVLSVSRITSRARRRTSLSFTRVPMSPASLPFPLGVSNSCRREGE